MLRLRFLSNKFQKRLIRPLYAQTQATPFAASLDSALGTGSALTAPKNGNTIAGVTYSADTFLYKNGLVPGTVMVKTTAGNVIPATGANAALKPFGLLANFVGGDLDELGDENTVGVWRGPDSVFEILTPGFDDTGLASAYSSATAGSPVVLYAAADGRLQTNASPANRLPVAELIERVSASRIVIDLKI